MANAKRKMALAIRNWGRKPSVWAKKGPRKEPDAAPKPVRTSKMPVFPWGISSIASEIMRI
jgi:hypothetical protein